MSLIKSNAVQIGQSGTADNNFVWEVPSSPDGTIKLARGNSGATTQDVLSVDASGNVAFAGITSLGDISNATVTATGTTTARDLATRMADVVNVKDFGAVGDGVADDTAAIQTAINKWVIQSYSKPASLYIPQGTYNVTSTILVNFTNSTLHEKTIKCDGVLVGSSLSGFSDVIKFLCTNAFVSGLNITGLSAKNPGNNGAAIKFDGGSNASLGALWKVTINQCYAHGGDIGSGFEFANGFFEASLYGCFANNISDSLYGFYFKADAGTGIISSIDMFGCTARGGKHGIYLQTQDKDVKIVGGTVLFAKQDGIRVDFAASLSIQNVHVENCGLSAFDMASSTYSGIRATAAKSRISNIYYNNSPDGRMKYAVRSYATSQGFIHTINGSDSTGLLKKTRTSNGTNGRHVIIDDEDDHDLSDNPQITFFGGKNISTHNTNLTIKRDGTDIVEYTTSGLRPVADNAMYLGSSAQQWSRVSSHYLEITDGITAPSVLAGQARLYVDFADGDLKIKFGDGTIKTIVTDT